VSAVSVGTQDDVTSWLEIAREVEPLFGPMPDFESTLRRNISRGTALCVRDPGGQVLGGMLLRAAPHSEHWVHLRTTSPIESAFATVRPQTKVTTGRGLKAAGLAIAFKLIESAQRRWRMVNAPHLVALVRTGATFVGGKLAERPGEDAPPKAT
jgi:hypothetical protein